MKTLDDEDTPETTAGTSTDLEAEAPRSLEEVHRSVPVPEVKAGFWRKWAAFTGPALLVSVGYMDPGNWATDLQAGADYRYGLLWVVALASLMAVFVQVIAARLGVVTGKDLAQACRDYYPAWTRWPNWLACETAIGACDLAEVLGSAIALKLLFGIPLLPAVLVTAFDVLLLLALQRYGIRKIEAFILTLVLTIGGCYFVEIFVLPATRPDFGAMGQALLRPELEWGNTKMVALAVAIIGATVMPHNLYLHSALVQTRRFNHDERSIRSALRFNTLDSAVALSLAFLVNAAILILAAHTFFDKKGLTFPDGRPISDEWLQGAYLTLTPLLGTMLASTLFAVALLASGQSSTITGTMAGQVVMEGFMHWRIHPWLRRLLTRGLAIVPAVVVLSIWGDSSVGDLLLLSQFVLGLQLPFALIPLMQFTSSSARMGKFVNPLWLAVAGWASAVFIIVLDIWSVVQPIADLWSRSGTTPQ